VVCVVRPLTDDTPFNRAIVVAAERAEKLLIRANAEEALIGLRRSVLSLTGAQRDRAPNFREVREVLEPNRPDHEELLALAELIINGVPALPRSESDDQHHPMSAWLNVERLFEEAVLTIVRRGGLPHGATVRSGYGDGVQLFSRVHGDPQTVRKNADPDVVIRLLGQTWLLDAKYRRHPRDFDDDELYQLMAHASAYQASVAALVAPARSGHPAGQRWLGRDNHGTTYYLITVDTTTRRGIEEPIDAWLRDQVRRRLDVVV
jgi:5-methylcytosine-specific restriction endonuclease McrBC regulatory subunit McrC